MSFYFKLIIFRMIDNFLSIFSHLLLFILRFVKNKQTNKQKKTVNKDLGLASRRHSFTPIELKEILPSLAHLESLTYLLPPKKNLRSKPHNHDNYSKLVIWHQVHLKSHSTCATGDPNEGYPFRLWLTIKWGLKEGERGANLFPLGDPESP